MKSFGFVAACFLLFGLPAATQERNFPHDVHLDQGLDCAGCHTSASKSNKAEDRLLPNAEMCRVCHSGQIAAEIDLAPLEAKQPPERTYRFDHASHLKLGNAAAQIAAAIDADKYMGKPGDLRRFLDTENSCVACHRGLDESKTVSEKPHMPQMADCIVCHNEIDNPFTCPNCHNEGVELRPADHTRSFIDLHSTGKLGLDKQTCLPCHGRNFACMGCH